jgi:hypothetical protein
MPLRRPQVHRARIQTRNAEKSQTNKTTLPSTICQAVSTSSTVTLKEANWCYFTKPMTTRIQGLATTVLARSRLIWRDRHPNQPLIGKQDFKRFQVSILLFPTYHCSIILEISIKFWRNLQNLAPFSRQKDSTLQGKNHQV